MDPVPLFVGDLHAVVECVVCTEETLANPGANGAKIRKRLVDTCVVNHVSVSSQGLSPQEALLQDGRAIITRSLTQTRQVLEFKDTKTEKPRDVKVPASALATLEEHRKRQNEFRRQFGSEYRADLDLIFANPNGTPLRPNSVSSVVSLLFRRLGLPKGRVCTPCATATGRTCWQMGCYPHILNRHRPCLPFPGVLWRVQPGCRVGRDKFLRYRHLKHGAEIPSQMIDNGKR
jgi:hypothetical protein